MGVIALVGDFGLSEIKDEAIQAKEQAQEILDSITNLENIGYYNANTNIATTISGNISLTATPPPSWKNGQYVEITVAGNVGFGGSNFLGGELLLVGDFLRKMGSVWFLVLGKVSVLQEQLDTVNGVATLAYLKANEVKTTTKTVLSLNNTPLYYYSIYNDTATQATQVVGQLQLDGIFDDYVDVAFKGNKPSVAINPKISGLQKFTLKSSTYQDLEVSVYNFTKNALAQTRQIIHHSISDSKGVNSLSADVNNSTPYWNHMSKMIYNSARLNIDSVRLNAANPAKPIIPKIIGSGHLSFQSRTATYRGNTITMRNGSSGQSGWAAAHYAFHPIRFSALPASELVAANNGITVNGVIDIRQIFVPDNISFYMLGLKTSSTVDYSGLASQKEAIRTTIYGKYSVDKVQALYDWMKARPEWAVSPNSFPIDTYTGTSTQNNNMDTFATWIGNNAGNPYYSRTKATTGGSTNAFKFSEYLSKYKTIDEVTLNRLVVGSTAGSLVTNANAYDVVTPTDVTIQFGNNDFWLFPDATAAQHVTVMRMMADTIIAEYSSIKVGLWVCPCPGSNFPDLYPTGIREAKSDPKKQMMALRAAMIANIGATQTNPNSGNVYYLDTPLYMYPNSHQYDQYAESAGMPIDYEETTVSSVHQGFYAAASIGDYIHGWLMNNR